MANSLSHAALPYPIRGYRYTLQLAFQTSAGALADPTTPDTELSVDGGASFADATEEITTGASAGVGHITLTGSETNNNIVAVRARSANCVDTILNLAPRVLASVGTGTLSAGSAGGGTLGTLLAYDVTGCFIGTTGGTGGGGTGGANNQVRKIVTYNTSTGAFTVTPNWETTPDNTTTYAVLLPEGVTLGMLKTLNPATAGRNLVVDSAGLADANVVKVGPTGSGTAQTAYDIGGNLGALNASASSGDPGTTTTVVQYLKQIINTLEGTAGIPTFPAAADAANAVSIAEVIRQINARIVGTLASGTHNAQSGDTYARLGAPAGGVSISADIAATAAELAKVPKSDGSVGWNATARAQIQTEAEDANVTHGLDHLVSASVAGADVADNSIIAKLASKSATADWDSFNNQTDALEAIRDRGDAAWVTGGGGGGLTGANTVTITVDDGTDPIVGAKVRLTDGVLGTGVIATDANGQAVFSVDDATWSVAITKPGYSFTPTTLVVNGDETQTYSMTAVTITPSAPGQVTGYLVCYNGAGAVESNTIVSLRTVTPPTGTGIALDSGQVDATSDANGIVQFPGMFPGAWYDIRRAAADDDEAKWLKFRLPTDATDPTDLNNIVGSP